jgi:hypothetical protein
MKRLFPILVTGLAGAFVCFDAAAAEPVFMNRSEVKWVDGPPSLPKGAKIAVLFGDPGKPGPFTMRAQMPANYKIAPHFHSQAEQLTVLSGALFLGMADKMDTAHAHALNVGGYHYLPAKAHHYAYTKKATVIQITGEGPFDIQYLNPADDPEKKK